MTAEDVHLDETAGRDEGMMMSEDTHLGSSAWEKQRKNLNKQRESPFWHHEVQV